MSSEPFGPIGQPKQPKPPVQCGYPNCTADCEPSMATCVAHAIAYKQWKATKRNERIKQERVTARANLQSKIQCAREGCKHWFTPKPTQRYHNAACLRIAENLIKRQEHAELARERKATRELRRAEAHAVGVTERELLMLKINQFWERVKDPTYYKGIRHRQYSTLLMTAAVSRIPAKAVNTSIIILFSTAGLVAYAYWRIYCQKKKGNYILYFPRAVMYN